MDREKNGCGDRIAELDLKLMLIRTEHMEFLGQQCTLIKLTQQERRSESINEQTVDASLPLNLDPQEQVQQRTVKRIAAAENKAVKDACVAYDADTKTARKDLVVIHPIRIGSILNFSLFPNLRSFRTQTRRVRWHVSLPSIRSRR